MEIALSKQGELRIVSLKGNLRLQHWRVVDKHLEALLANGSRWVVMDLSGATLIGEEGIASLLHSVRSFREHEAHLMLFSASPHLPELLRACGGEAVSEDILFTDWQGLEACLQGRGLPSPGLSHPPIPLRPRAKIGSG